MKLQIPIIACLLAALPVAALADSHGDRSYSRPAAPARTSQSAPARSYQSAPSRSYQQAPRTQQAPRYTQQAPRYTQQAPRYTQQAPRYTQQAPRYTQQAPRYTQQAPRYTQQASRYSQASGFRPPVRTVMPRNVARVGDRAAWQWNGGRAWSGSPSYWGGGFWGSFSIGLAFNDYGNYGYYPVQTSSPGADLLAQYGLQQTDCNQPNLVQIFGPDGSEVCAYPNDEVGPGQYQVDMSTLTLVSN